MKKVALPVVYIAIALIVILIIVKIVGSRKQKKYKQQIEALDKEKNEIESAPVISELAKLETIAKNDNMEKKYKAWLDAFENVRNNDIPKINDMIINLDVYIEKREYKEYILEYAKTELAIYKARTTTDNLLDEIKEVNLSGEKYRNIIIKLKARYRELQSTFESKKDEYENIASVIELQFENIEKRFQDFEEYMDINDYQEVYHIIKAINNMIEHMGVVIEEVPDLVLLANRVIPKKIEQITDEYEEMKKEKYPLKHLKIEYNVEESLKKVNEIIDRIKVLNLENCLFELKTMLEYLDTLFNEFDKEKRGKISYEENKPLVDSKIEKMQKTINDVYLELDELKSAYDLSEDNINSLALIKEKVDELDKEYTKDVRALARKTRIYSDMAIKMEEYLDKSRRLEDELTDILRNFGNMKDDEERAREQLDEIQDLLKESKNLIRSYKLPIIADNYFVELSEANDSIVEIIKELENKPISITTLNTRVDTSRDLAFKLYNTTSKMVRNAKLAETLIVYGNRYRNDVNVDRGLKEAENYFNRGNYEKSMSISLNTIEKIDETIRERARVYEESN